MRNKRVIITQKDLDAYARQMKEEGKALNTIGNYRRMLTDLYDWLPEDKQLGKKEIRAFLYERRLNAEQRLVGWTDGVGASQLAVR